MVGKHLMPVAFCGVSFLLGGAFCSESASAASPAYCALYAREYSAQFATGNTTDAEAASEYRIQAQAYARCLNQDVEPAFPETSVYFGATVDDIVGGIGGSLEPIAEGDAAGDVPDVPVDEPVAKPKPKQTASSGSSGNHRGSGLKAFTPEWEAWCKAHFPNSFDALTGYVKPYGEEPRLCK